MDTTYNNIIESKSIKFLHRVAISKGLSNKDSITTISKELNFTRKTIYDEIKRGTMEKMNTDLTTITVYDVYKADHLSRNSLSNRGRLTKVDDNIHITEFIKQELLNKNSPEVIAYKIENNNTFENKISARTIYNWVYNRELELDYTILPYSKGKKRKKHKQEKNRIKPNGGFSIEERPNIDDRYEFGHWEIDCVVGQRNGKSTSLLTLVERKTRYGIVLKIDSKSKANIVKALKKIKKTFGKYFYEIFKSITADNGSEFKDAIGMSLEDKNGNKVKIYYAHAYCSWERGTNENFNKMLRRMFPKGTNFGRISNKRIKECTDWINNYPRKQFNFETSIFRFNNEINNIS